MKKKVLSIYYSQSGQLSSVLHQFTLPLAESDSVELHQIVLRPKPPYPFPWPFVRFFDTFPEAVYLDPPELEPLGMDANEHFDLIILGYQVWFLSPSLPITAFLKSPEARVLLHETPVVTVIACRNMWLLAQEQTKKMLAACGARLVGNVALVDEMGSVGSLLSTPIWLMTGNKGPFLGGLIPRAAIKQVQISRCRRFGERIEHTLRENHPIDTSLLRNLHAVKVNTNLITTERAARRGFLVWGALLRLLGRQGVWTRRPIVVIYFVFLVVLLITILPASSLFKILFGPFLRKHFADQEKYFSEPSGG